MKYYLVDKYDNINTSVDLGSNVGVSGARTYFIGTKKLDENSFDKLWRVMTEQEYETISKIIYKIVKWTKENTNGGKMTKLG